ncbi:MAG: histidine kinase [Oscillospiraceae bacterium]|nr:histidine kinase [Oscillospiraceae bacterium]
MQKGIRFHFEQMSIHHRMYVIVVVSVLMFALLFGFIFGIMVRDLQDSVIDRQAQILTLLCTDIKNALDSTEDLALSLVTNSTIKTYVSSGSGEKEKNTLTSMMSRPTWKNLVTSNNIDVVDLMVIRSEQDYVRSGSTYVSDKSLYDSLARYICDNYTPGNHCMALSGYLRYTLDCYCYVLPLADSATSAIQRGGYLVLLVDNYSFTKMLDRYYEAGTTISIVDSYGTTVFCNAANEAPDLSEVLGDVERGNKKTARINGKNNLVITQELENLDWTVILCTPTSSVTAQMQKYWILFMIFLILLAGITVILISTISRSMTHRLKEMVDVITSIREGDIDCRFPVVYHDEISIIGDEFNRMIDQIQKYHLNAAVNELRRKEAELNALQSSINPHFLYNSLDCIRASALVNQDMRVAHQIQILANMFRYTTGYNSMRGGIVTVDEEMKHVYDYLSMLSFRFEDRYDVEIHVDRAILPMRIPKLVLQPIVENSFQHGIRNLATQGRVNIRGYLEGEAMILSVEDNGVGIPPEKLETLQQLLQANPLSTVDMPYRALININDRIRITYGQEYGVSLESIPGKRTRTMIRLPITKEER